MPSADDVGDLGEEPPLDRPEALRAWMNARDVETFERGIARGKIEGIAEGKAAGIVEEIARGKAEGIAEGIATGKAAALLSILQARGLAVSPEVRAIIEGCKDAEVIEGWIGRVISAGSEEEVVGAAAGLPHSPT